MPTIYRADNQTLGQLKFKRGFRTYTYKPPVQVRDILNAQIRRDSAVGFCRDHRNNRLPYALSCAVDATCDGYRSIRSFAYRMNLPLSFYDIASGESVMLPGGVIPSPILCCEAGGFVKRALTSTATTIGVGIPGTKEVAMLAGIPLDWITHQSVQGNAQYNAIDWAAVRAALP